MSSTNAASPSRAIRSAASSSVTVGSVSVMASAYSMTSSSSALKVSRDSRHRGTASAFSADMPCWWPSQ
ncbi:hypothetical protein SF23_14695 [Streptomyces sp. MBRL 10]|nr:hypothetical protein SF23_14695 [Streptomyces sp. MBRL 10]